MTRPYGTAPVTLADGRPAYERNAARPLNPPRPVVIEYNARLDALGTLAVLLAFFGLCWVGVVVFG